MLMRALDIPPSSIGFSLDDLSDLYRERVQQKPCARSETSVPLLGYMAWPKDPASRWEGRQALSSWLSGNGPGLDFRIIHQHWARVADILNLTYALSEGHHQRSRGGASLGKAVFLASRRIKGRGAMQASLWRQWTAYKDVAHLVAAAVAVCFDIQTRHRQRPFGMGLQELLPTRVVALFPDLVLGLALTYQEFGLDRVRIFDPATLWRVPVNINIEPVPAPHRRLLPEEIAILNARRAGNRGSARRGQTTLISA